MRKLSTILLIGIMIFSFWSCSAGNSGNQASLEGDLMKDIDVDISMSQEEMTKDLDGQGSRYLAKFSASLIKACNSEDNVLISPLSVIYALAMTTNGAKGESQYQLLDALTEGEAGVTTCGTSSTGVGDIWDEKQDDLNRFLRAYLNKMATKKEWLEKEGGTQGELHIANSIWFKDDESLQIEKDFLKTNGTYYDAGIVKTRFNEETRQQINKWIEDNTAGMIKDMLKELPDEAVMYLINALSFEGNWVSPFGEYQVHEGVFHGENGDTEGISFMYDEEGDYLEDEKAKGFIKYYYGWEYGFAALLPKEGVTVDEYIESMDGEALQNMIKNPSYKRVNYSIPKFSEESSLSLVGAFKKLGVETPFDSDNADFSKLGTSSNGNIYIGNIFHDTYIEVDEKGTKAGAATIVEMVEETAIEFEDKPEEVYLDRPFIYMIVDLKLGIPVFIGTIKNL